MLARTVSLNRKLSCGRFARKDRQSFQDKAVPCFSQSCVPSSCQFIFVLSERGSVIGAASFPAFCRLL
jgi:hypothetical protein